VAALRNNGLTLQFETDRVTNEKRFIGHVFRLPSTRVANLAIE